MSSVVLQVGQCGNQIGREFWKCVDSEESIRPVDIWRHHDRHYRSVNTDTEPKVVRRMIVGGPTGGKMDDGAGWFSPSNLISSKTGRGSNWAMGYHSNTSGGREDVFERTMEALRREIECCDSFQGVITIQSLGGGTGSGVGTRLAEMIRDEHSPCFITSCVVAPFIAGEGATQQYNSTLALASLVRSADCIFMIDNDEVLHRVEKRGDDSTVVSLEFMNRHIAAALAGVFLPVDAGASETSRSIGSEPWDALRTICPMPSLKFVNVDSAGFDRSKPWAELSTQLLGFDVTRPEAAILSALVVMRQNYEPNDRTFVAALRRMEERIQRQSVAWNPFPVCFWSAVAKEAGPKRSTAHNASYGAFNTLTMAKNDGSVAARLDTLVSAACAKYDARAYLHWYERYGCTQSDFDEAFETLNTVTDSYRSAVL